MLVSNRPSNFQNYDFSVQPSMTFFSSPPGATHAALGTLIFSEKLLFSCTLSADSIPYFPIFLSTKYALKK